MAEGQSGVAFCKCLGLALEKNAGDKLCLVRTLAEAILVSCLAITLSSSRRILPAQRHRHCTKGNVRRLLLNVTEVHDHLDKKSTTYL